MVKRITFTPSLVCHGKTNPHCHQTDDSQQELIVVTSDEQKTDIAIITCVYHGS